MQNINREYGMLYFYIKYWIHTQVLLSWRFGDVSSGEYPLNTKIKDPVCESKT